jgi:4-amino-4-deoxychorismate lyase
VRAVLIDGVAPQDTARAISIADRGLNYGDGVFETMLLREGRVPRLDAHLERLVWGCGRLGIAAPDAQLLQREIASVAGANRDGVVKIIVTRGSGGRGYRPGTDVVPCRIVSLHDSPPAFDEDIRVRWCEMRLSRNPALAGIKHLNRLEQVLAQREWNDAQIDEGLMLDYEGELVCGTSSNLFLVLGRELMTPDLRYCGVRGIMRGAVIQAATILGIPVHEEPLWPDNLEGASEVFVTNAVRGVRSVVSLDERSWPRGEVTQAIRKALELHA